MGSKKLESFLQTQVCVDAIRIGIGLLSHIVAPFISDYFRRYNGILSADRLRQMRSLNPFRSFLNEKRIKMKREHPELAARDIVSIVAAIWNGSPETEKSEFPGKWDILYREDQVQAAVSQTKQMVSIGLTFDVIISYPIFLHSDQQYCAKKCSVRELLKAARAKKAQEEEESQTSQSKNDQYLWDYQSCVQGKNGDYDKEISTAATVAITSGTVSNPANNSLYTPCKACFLPSFIAFDKKLDGEEHRLRLRESYVRKQLTAVTEELADKKVRDEKVKLSLSKNDQEVTDALLWTDFIYRVCLVNALKSIRVPGFHSAVTTENVLEFLRAAAILVKEKNAKDRRFIGRFKSIMEKLTMPKAPC
ncbi:HMG box domain containing protein [Trichuris trichiura]|uniref:HMG box domain containing protein n=1 Tax=Trichuris trichiura TaxID=36087 RepID=A0A077YWU5_TRITR|nr:HMG box domain containing protein [Trichuris trichiura]